jgi:glutamyl-tRNA synthetase
VLLRTDGVPLYNFGAVVDDVTMGITLVARGRDHMVNTPPQILIYEALGAKVPEFAHLPMMLAPSGEKLSKRHGTVSVTEYREKGYTPEGVLNYLVRFGWSCGDREIFSMEELVEAFTWETCGRGDGKFDAKKFLAVNHEHMKQDRLQSTRTYAGRAKPFLVARGLMLAASDDHLTAALETVRERSRTFVEAAEGVDFYFRAEPVLDEAAAAKFLVPAAAERLQGFTQALVGAPAWEEKALEAVVHAWLEAAGLQIKDVAQAARVALTGRSASPGLFEVLAVLGREVSLARLDAGRARASAAPAPAQNG